MKLTPTWEYVADTVMGGVSTGSLNTECLSGRMAARLTGRVSLKNNGGFIQMAFPLQQNGDPLDASAFSGIEVDVIGNNEVYDLRLRTDQLTKPWQSYRTSFLASQKWTTTRHLFVDFENHRTDIPFDVGCLRRIGILAIGREFDADVAVSAVRLFP